MRFSRMRSFYKTYFIFAPKTPLTNRGSRNAKQWGVKQRGAYFVYVTLLYPPATKLMLPIIRQKTPKILGL